MKLANVRHFTSLVTVVALGACGTDAIAPSTATIIPDRPAAQAGGPNDFSDGQGKAWRQLTETVNLSWTATATVCPRDGFTPCTGSVGGRDLTGWVWATEAQLLQLYERYVPGITAVKAVGGGQYYLAAAFALSDIRPTQWFANTYSAWEQAAGWSSSTDSLGQPIGGGVSNGHPPPSGGLGVGSIPNPNEVNAVRGVYLWRADGSGGTAAVANDDAGSVASPGPGTAVANVLVNDQLASAPATTANVSLSTISASAGLSLDPTDGSVDVAFGVPVGTWTLVYRICATASPTNCDTATVTVNVTGNLVNAVDDAGSAKTTGGAAVANVLSNDTFAGGAASLTQVTLSLVSSSDPAVTLDTDGSVDVAPGASTGAKALLYRLCETSNPTNCDQATVTVTVVPLVIDAVSDAGSAPSSLGGMAVANVLVNDKLDGVAATLTTVSLEQVSSGQAGITLDTGDGSVDVAPGTPGGTWSLTYRICERANTSNCDTANVAVTVAPQTIVVSKKSFTVKEGKVGSFTVKLGQQPSGSVVVSVAYLAGTAVISPTPTSITFTPATWSTPITVRFTAPQDADEDDNGATLRLTSPGATATDVVVKIRDNDASAGDPIVTIQNPLNGQTVSGLVDFWGKATSSTATLVDGKFYVDGNRIYTDTNGSGTYRVAGKWNSASVPNGWHTLDLRVEDNASNKGVHSIRVFVNN